jgi:FKBP-type peptidyl-prolyl cis-trans isomerase (trigger factor)
MNMNAQALQFDTPIERPLSFELKQEDPFFCYGSVRIHSSLIDRLYKEASLSQQFHAQTAGFHKGEVPFEYVTEYFKSNITSHLKELVFKYFVVGFLYQEIRNHKLIVAGEPRLIEIDLQPSKDGVFTFELSLFPTFQVQEWKYLPFKAPKRKNYKDLDRQVETFIEEEKKFLEISQAETLDVGDWVHFDITFLERKTSMPLLGNHTAKFWLKLGDEEADTIYHEMFLGKKAGDSFISTSRALQNYFNDHIDANYSFSVKIIEILKNNYFCLEHFKRHFKLKTNKELYQKLIEVFSYRNDLSLRRSMAEESLKLLLSKHRFVIPNYLVLRQQKNIIDKIKTNPDFHVYRMQKDFQERVKQLAEKQVRELVFLDQLAYYEDIEVAEGDLKGYLNFTNRQRMKDFLYFDTPTTKIGGQELPMVCEELNRFYLREKALNHIIYHLMKK